MGLMDKFSKMLGRKPVTETVKGPSMVLREAGIDPSDLKFSFGADNSITVSGNASSQAECDSICQALKEMPNIKSVQNNITIGAPEPEPAPPPRVEATGESEWDGRSCTKFDVYENDIKVQEVCSAPLDQVNGAAEMMDTFQGMARFVKKLSESLPGPLGSSFNEHPGMVAELIGGFPVHTIEYRMGEPESEVSLEEIREEQLPASRFEAPEDYQLQDPFAAR